MDLHTDEPNPLAILLAGAHPGGNSSQSIYVLSLAPHPNEVALAEQRLWSDLTAQFHEAAQQTNTEVRVGYFGLCARLINQSGWECTKNGESLFTRLGPDATDTINILRLADDFKSSVLFPGLVSVNLHKRNADATDVCVASEQWLCQFYALLG